MNQQNMRNIGETHCCETTIELVPMKSLGYKVLVM